MKIDTEELRQHINQMCAQARHEMVVEQIAGNIVKEEFWKGEDSICRQVLMWIDFQEASPNHNASHEELITACKDVAQWLEETHARPDWNDRGAQQELKRLQNVITKSSYAYSAKAGGKSA